jgi:hypothetical protein
MRIRDRDAGGVGENGAVIFPPTQCPGRIVGDDAH